VGVPADRLSRLGEKDNFWAMGDTGPCGPCTEIFYDHGPEVAGGPPGSPDDDGDRYIEIWNLVFMQFDRQPDGALVRLPKPSVDTGMGLERLAAVLQHVHSNYEIDLFQALLKAAAAITGTADTNNTSLRVIADHIRSCSFLVADGVLPSNEGRGYVLRRIIRRAVRHGYQLGVKDIFFFRLVPALVEQMGEAYPELKARQEFVEKVLREEEQQFARTLENGMAILKDAIAGLHTSVVPGDTVFRLYDTFGFPVDLTADVAREHQLTLDMEGFERAMAVQKQQARAASQFNAVEKLVINLEQGTQFTGYDTLQGHARVLAIYSNGQQVQAINAQEEALLILNASPFYAESGGQVGDKGLISCHRGAANEAVFEIIDTQKQGEHFIHKGILRSGTLAEGDEVDASVAAENRAAIALNHSATHLLHAALRKVLGAHVTQKGSLVSADRLRFDFSHQAAVTAAELAQIEAMVNAEILRNSPVSKQIMGMEQAMNKGAMALFGEKYGDEVRVVSMGDFSTELCGGTHVERTGDIGLFKFVSESGVAAGVRRVEAVTGKGALALVERQEALLKQVCDVVKTNADSLVEKVQQLMSANKALERELEQTRIKLASAGGSDMGSGAQAINGVNVLVKTVEGLNARTLRETVDQLKNKLGTAIVVLACIEEGKASIVAGVSKDVCERVKAGDLVNMVASHVGGKGGGRPDMAMAGGPDVAGLPAGLAAVPAWVEARLQ